MQKNRKMELLSPAGDMASLRAAVGAGADAVYLGYSAFGARASAANFDAETLQQAVSYAHLHGVRVYVTVNTLVKPQELEAVYQALSAIALGRADAVIVQDLGVAMLIRRYFPTLSLHASTQMALHNASGVLWAGQMGFHRVVLARECTIEDIALASETGIDIEVFVHGALCAGVSGQCLLSSLAGGRSGNRGRCAQPCRHSFSMGDAKGALLSTRDLCLRDGLPLLQKAGVRSIKIEGRLKRPEYVAIVTDSYRRALDAMAAGRFISGNTGERETLMQVFHRGGFSGGHALGAQDHLLCDASRTGHGGIIIGKVVRLRGDLATLQLSHSLHDGDGLQVRGIKELDVRYAGKDKKAGEEAILRIRSSQEVHVGDKVYCLTSVQQMETAKALMKEPLIPVQMEAEVVDNMPMRIVLRDGCCQIEVDGELPQKAKSRAITTLEVEKQLIKLGDTPFTLKDKSAFSLLLDEDLFVPVRSLNELRRKATDLLRDAREEKFFGSEKEALLAEVCTKKVQKEQENQVQVLLGINEEEMCSSKRFSSLCNELVVRFSTAAMGNTLREAGASTLIYYPLDMNEASLQTAVHALPIGTWLELPPFLGEEDLRIAQAVVQKERNRLGGVVLGSVGQLGAAFAVPTALGGGIPVTNHLAQKTLADFQPAFYTQWPEWNQDELQMLTNGNIPSLLTVYGRERLMLLSHCPHRVSLGLNKNRGDCNLCGDEEAIACGVWNAKMTDRKGYQFPLRRVRLQRGCVLELLNALPIDLRKHEKTRKKIGAGMLVSLTCEEERQQHEVVSYFASLLRGNAVGTEMPPYSATAGHLLRGVE